MASYLSRIEAERLKGLPEEDQARCIAEALDGFTAAGLEQARRVIAAHLAGHPRCNRKCIQFIEDQLALARDIMKRGEYPYA